MRVLHIEDDMSTADATGLALNLDRIETVHAEFGEAGIALAAAEAFGAILLDLTLPDMRGDGPTLRRHGRAGRQDLLRVRLQAAQETLGRDRRPGVHPHRLGQRLPDARSGFSLVAAFSVFFSPCVRCVLSV